MRSVSRLPAPARRPVCSRRAAVSVRAELNDPLRNVSSAVDSFLRRYDVLSTGVGALVVTSWCVYAHGQDPWTALSITATSTVVALVANEVLFNNNKH